MTNGEVIEQKTSLMKNYFKLVRVKEIEPSEKVVKMTLILQIPFTFIDFVIPAWPMFEC